MERFSVHFDKTLTGLDDSVLLDRIFDLTEHVMPTLQCATAVAAECQRWYHERRMCTDLSSSCQSIGRFERWPCWKGDSRGS